MTRFSWMAGQAEIVVRYAHGALGAVGLSLQRLAKAARDAFTPAAHRSTLNQSRSPSRALLRRSSHAVTACPSPFNA